MAVQINVAANQAALTASIQAGVQAYNQKFAQNNQINLSVNQRAFSQPLGRMTGDVKDFEAALAASNARVIAFGASTAVLGGVIRSFKELATVTIDVEKNLADINRVFGLTTNQLQKFSTDLFNVGKQTASTFDDASKAALEFSRQGLKAEDVLVRTKDALTLTRLAGIGTANAVDALTSTVNGFAATGVTTTQVLNKLVAVEQDYAVGAGDLAEALSRTGQAAQEAGVSLDQLNALVTAAQQSTARGGAVIGNALKTIFTRLQRNETLDQLEAFNIAVRDVQGNTLPAVQILQNFAGAYKGLADAQRAQLSEQVAGVYQVNILKAIVGDLNKSQGVYAGALQRGASATNEAEVATAKLNQTLDALLKQTATSTQQLANNIGKVTFEPLAKYGTEQLKSFVENINEVLEGEGAGSTFANGLLKGIRNVIAGPGAIAAFFTLFKLIQNSFTYLSQALPQIAGITTETQNRKNIEQSILQIMQQQGPAAQALSGLMGNQAAQAQLLLQIARQQTAEYQMQTTLAKQLAVQLAGQGVKVKGSGGLQVTRAGGYIPNATRMAEVVGAQAGGYTPGRVVSSPVGGVMNTAEDVKYIPGFAQPFINPPANSDAGRAHRQNAITRTGVDPYMYSGFIPNFAKKIANQFAIGRAFEQSVGIDIGVPPAWNEAIDFKEVLEKPVSKNFNPKLYQSNTFADAHSGLGHKSSENISKVINHLGQNYYSYLPRQGSKTKRLKLNDKTSIISQPDLLGDLFIRPRYTEIIGEGYDNPTKENTSSISSLNDTAKKTLLNGVSESDFKRIEKRKIKMQFAQDKVYNSGFIPNFAPPTSAIRIPWFKKFGNPAFDAIQPALGISKASDVDTFRQINFKSTAEKADERGDSNIFAPLFEDFAFKAMQLVSQQDVKDDLIRGYVLQPGTNQKQSAFDAALEKLGIGLEYKGYPKTNLTGSITGELTRKYQSLSKTNPEKAAKLKELIIAFNEVGHENQITSELGKKLFSPLAGVSYSQMVKNSPDLVKGLSAETNSLLNSYVKNPAFLKMAAASGFIPNFAYKQAVMGLEESMSGNKAIFDTKPFPHIRNSSQPTFSSAIADHGGLSNALSDSMRGQKAAGLMSRGFIPNFAPKPYRYSGRGTIVDPSSGVSQYSSGLGFSLADQEKRAKDEFNKIINALRAGAMNAQQATDAFNNLNTQAGLSAKAQGNLTKILQREVASAGSNQTSPTQSRFAKLSEGLSKASTAISIAGPMLAGFAEQAIFGDKKRTELTSKERFGQSFISTGLSSISTGAGIGASFGWPGALIGGVAGGLVALTSALNATTLSAEELTQLNQEQAQKSQASISAASSYIEAQKSLTEMISSGASSSEIENASKKLSSAFNDIADVKLQEIFNATGGDVKQMTKQLQDYTNQVSKKGAFETALTIKGKEKETAKGLGFSLNKDQKSQLIADLLGVKSAKESSALAAQNIATATARAGGMAVSLKGDEGLSYIKNVVTKLLESQGYNENTTKDYASILSNAIDTFMSLNIDKFIEELNKSTTDTETQKVVDGFNQIATKSFAQIFIDMQETIKKSSYDIALSFEKDSSSRRIQSSILDFSMSFQDSLNSFLSNNLPDARKLDFAAATAGQKAQMLLQKSQQDYDKAIADQANERANFLTKNSENLITSFHAAMKGLPSQINAQFFEKEILPDIQKGVFTGNAESVIERMQQSARQKVNEASMSYNGTTLNLGSSKEIDAAYANAVNSREQAVKAKGQPELIDPLIKSLLELKKSNDLYTNQEEKKKLDYALKNYAKEQEIFESKQANAKKELDINKQLNEARIAVDRDIAKEKAKVDKENLMRMESMKDLSASIGNSLEISKARSTANVNAMQRRLEDQRETYGMGRSEVSERKFRIQADILKEQRAAEDAAINAEIQQRILEMAAEQENTAATLKLNDTIMTLIETQLRGELGGTGKIEEINSLVNVAGYSEKQINDQFGPQAFEKYQAYKRIEESRISSAANNASYNTSNFSSKMESANFNKMDQAEQLKFLEQEETKARNAGNIVLAGTIKRYQDQIKAKKEALKITRDDIDAQIRLATEIEKVNNTFAGRFKKGWGNLKQEGDDLLLNLGENLPKMFADGLVDGIKAAIRESNNLGEALMGIASKFLDSISTTLMQSAVYGILGSIGVPNLPVAGKQRGGVIRAQSGMYVSGVGSGDKYPALLENGEYVLNRNAVMAMGGPASLDKLNFSAAPRFAAGGSFSNKFEDVSSMESNMTSYGLEESKLYNELRDQKRAEIEADRQKRRAQKQQMAGLIGSLAGAAVSLGISAGINKFNQPVKLPEGGYAATPAGQLEIAASGDAGLSPEGLSIVQNQAVFATPKPTFGRRQIGGSIGSRLSDTIPAYATGGLIDSPIVKRYAIGGISSAGFGTAAGNSSTINNNTNASNSFNFNTTVQRDGKIEIGSNSTSYAQQDVELSQNLNSKVYEVVLDTIRKEKRFGGSLAGIRN